MQTLELLQLAKRPPDEAALNSEEIKPIALTIIVMLV